MTEKFAEINGIKICYEINGRGFPLVLIHGYGGKKEYWFAVKDFLASKFQLITFDLRNSGKSERLNQPITMDVFAEDVKSLINYLNLDQINIGGTSLGGMITQKFILKYPERVNKAIFINTHYNGKMGEIILETTKEQVKNFSRNYEKNEDYWEEAKFLFHRKMRREMMENPKKKFYGIWTAEDLIELTETNPPTIEDTINQGNAFKGFDTYDQLKNIRNPVLLIASSHDRILPKSQMIEMHHLIPNSRLEIIEKAGHWSPISRAPEISQILLDFLSN
ncbi:MAG: alpha/beta fold hydrolase [Candidatus Lokiarchaeota archaeon]|nr:alpha/beta fold hydrolase [Candidatus Lokiarchaeota archaeon]MBD3339768.1 alpha/beta fold hydrolase [Candidatus Lokiarchaeota archaeon]